MGNLLSRLRAEIGHFAALSVLVLISLGALFVLLSIGTAPASADAPPTPAASEVGDYSTHLPMVGRSYSSIVHPDDTYYDREWGLEAVDAPGAWSREYGCSSVLLAVIDSGVDLDHPDLADKLRVDIDWDFVNDDSDADDDYGHGTHVAGIAAAATNNDRGVAGIGWETSVLPLKVLDADGSGWGSDMAEAIVYATNHGADVINMSLMASAPCPTYIQDAVDYAHASGVTLVAIAGNQGANVENFPANCDHVIGVAATEPGDSVATYSSFGDHVDVAAPGSAIYNTTMGGGYGYKSGTSMAAPMVSGLAALLRNAFPGYTPDQIASAILDNADDLGDVGWDAHTGCGRINASQSLASGARGDLPVCLAAAGTSAEAEVAAPTAAFLPGEVLVAFEPTAKGLRSARRYGNTVEFLPSIGVWRVRVVAGSERSVLSSLRADPEVAHADLNYRITGE
jgi:subtilisin family serine protease